MTDGEDADFFGHVPSVAGLRRLLGELDPTDETGQHVRLLLTQLPETPFDEAIVHGESALARAQDDPSLRFDLHFALAFRYEERWEVTRDTTDLGQAIDHLEEIAPFLGSALPLTMLGRLLLARNVARRSEEDVEAAIKWLRTAQSRPDADHETQAFLGIALELQHESEGEALPLLRDLLLSDELEEPLLDLVTHRLSRLHFTQHVTSPASLAKLKELDTAIEHARSGDLDDPEQAYDLGHMLGRRFAISAEDSDRSDAIGLFERLLTEVAPGSEPADMLGDELSELYVTFCRTGSPAEANSAVARLEALRNQVQDESELVRLALAEGYSLRRSERRNDVGRLIELLGELSGDEAFVRAWRVLAEAEQALAGHCSDEQLDRVAARLWATARADVSDHKGLLTLLIAGAHVLARRHLLSTGGWSPLGAMPDFNAVTGPRELALLRSWQTALPPRTPGGAELQAAIALFRSHLCGEVPGPEAVEELEEQRATIEELSRVVIQLRPDDALRTPLRLQLALQRMNRTAVLKDPPGLEKVLRSLKKLLGDCPHGHPLNPLVKILLGTALLHRHNQFELPVDLAGVRELLLTADPGELLDEPIWALARFALARVEVLLGAETRDPDMLNRGVTRHQEMLDRLALGDHARHNAVCGLAWSLLMRYLATGDAEDLRAAAGHLRDVGSRPRAANALYEPHDLENLETMIGFFQSTEVADDPIDLSALLSSDAATSAEVADTLLTLRRLNTGIGEHTAAFGTYLDLLENVRAQDVPGIREAASKLKAAAGREVVEWQTGVVLTMMASMGCLTAHRMSGDAAALDDAVELLEKSVAAGLLDLPASLGAAEHLTEAWWLRGTEVDVDTAVATGYLFLRRYARQILIQRDLAECASLAATAAAAAVGWARRCLSVGRPEPAFALLEIGRTLRLHAATNLPAVLRGTIAPDVTALHGPSEVLTDAEASAIAGGRVAIPDDRRRRALDAADPREIDQWPPTPDAGDLARALRRLRLDFLVYLVPGEEGTAGYAVHLSRSGELGSLPLPDLVPDGANAADVGTSCEWAWRTAMGPLCAHLPDARRIALIPCGDLGRIPWHAAREPGTGRYLPERLRVTYGASAHQLGELSRRPALPREAGMVFVADAVDAGIGEDEARYLAGLHPHGRFFGHPSWTGTTPVSRRALVDVLLEDDRPAVLHLACHAVAEPDPVNARIGSGAAAISVLDLLTAGARRADREPGGLVVTAACETDLGGASDEGLTIATALLATGASSVIGTKWRVSTHQTAVLMCFLHHELSLGRSPSEALHATQVWALDPDRTPLEGLPGELAAIAVSPALADPRYWAAFTHHGR
ncbi:MULTISPECIES: CHAT domain-containing protein [unclassified Amycolatopsis]|uniref:CHAT domain-containing protein n=1 Tax=unclassified Amycolatopsis TaxID=2618356 RepID=UPI002875169A|nr:MULTISPECIES: CHAT domain-containing protein [unclassified Amycolatopsis]MDS0133226.1 CHAT domain-containing protein [Amycolatopsis sp. 505]MDS0146456.1 CHAT domain-containing protein [Amycolatopsis sp. CM201R]